MYKLTPKPPRTLNRYVRSICAILYTSVSGTDVIQMINKVFFNHHKRIQANLSNAYPLQQLGVQGEPSHTNVAPSMARAAILYNSYHGACAT